STLIFRKIINLTFTIFILFCLTLERWHGVFCDPIQFHLLILQGKTERIIFCPPPTFPYTPSLLLEN
ncbi:hypothetical protein C0J52_06885, partial [Blattella germanica]